MMGWDVPLPDLPGAGQPALPVDEAGLVPKSARCET